MNSSELEIFERHKILSVIIKTEEMSPNGKDLLALPLRLRNMIQSRARRNEAIVFEQQENELPGFRVFLFMRYGSNFEALSVLKRQYRIRHFKWKTQNGITISVDMNQMPTSYLSSECIMKRVYHFLQPQQLFEKTRKLMQLFDDVVNSADTKKKLESLEHSVLEIANRIGKGNAKTHMFGSRITGLADWESDIDIYVETGDTFCTGIDIDRQRKLVRQFQEVMKAQPHLYSNFAPMLSSNYIAVLRFRYIELGLECDLNFKSGISVINNELMKTYLQIDPRVKYVVCGVKCWMKTTGQKKNFLSYTQTWLVLFFLMQKNVVPTVDALRSMLPTHEQISMIQGWNFAFPDIMRINWSSTCLSSREELLKEFFAFYSDHAFSLQSQVLYTSSGRMRNKIEFINNCKSKYSADEFCGIMYDFRSPLCILDPFVHIKNLNRFTRYCEESFCMFVEYCRQTKDMPL